MHSITSGCCEEEMHPPYSLKRFSRMEAVSIAIRKWKIFLNLQERCLTIPYTPQQNEITERKNHCSQKPLAAYLSQKFWAKAIHTSNYLRNRCITKGISECTPFEDGRDANPIYDICEHSVKRYSIRNETSFFLVEDILYSCPKNESAADDAKNHDNAWIDMICQEVRCLITDDTWTLVDVHI